MRIAYQYLHDAADADEAVQDAFSRCSAHIGSYREAWPFEVWFTRILINGCLDRRKARAAACPLVRAGRHRLRSSTSRARHSAAARAGRSGSAAARPRAAGAAGRGDRSPRRPAADDFHVVALRRLHAARSQRHDGPQGIDRARPPVSRRTQAARPAWEASRDVPRAPPPGRPALRLLSGRTGRRADRAAGRRAPRPTARSATRATRISGGFMDGLRAEADAELDEVFPAERAASAAAAHCAGASSISVHPARVISFPRPSAGPARCRSRPLARGAAMGRRPPRPQGSSSASDWAPSSIRRGHRRAREARAVAGTPADRPARAGGTACRADERSRAESADTRAVPVGARDRPGAAAHARTRRARRADAARARNPRSAPLILPSSLIFRKGLDLKHAVAGMLAESYHSTLVEQIKADDFTYRAGRLTIHLAREFGFCYGVDRAVDYAYQTRRRFPDRAVYLTGEIIHNPHVNDQLRAMGVRFLSDTPGTVERLDADDVVILPAFGVTMSMLQQLERRGCTLIDTTCGSVLNVWKNVRRYAEGGYTRSSTARCGTRKRRPRRPRPSSTAGAISSCSTTPRRQSSATTSAGAATRPPCSPAFPNAVSPGFDPGARPSAHRPRQPDDDADVGIARDREDVQGGDDRPLRRSGPRPRTSRRSTPSAAPRRTGRTRSSRS